MNAEQRNYFLNVFKNPKDLDFVEMEALFADLCLTESFNFMVEYFNEEKSEDWKQELYVKYCAVGSAEQLNLPSHLCVLDHNITSDDMANIVECVQESLFMHFAIGRFTSSKLQRGQVSSRKRAKSDDVDQKSKVSRPSKLTKRKKPKSEDMERNKTLMSTSFNETATTYTIVKKKGKSEDTGQSDAVQEFFLSSGGETKLKHKKRLNNKLVKRQRKMSSHNDSSVKSRPLTDPEGYNAKIRRRRGSTLVMKEFADYEELFDGKNNFLLECFKRWVRTNNDNIDSVVPGSIEGRELYECFVTPLLKKS